MVKIKEKSGAYVKSERAPENRNLVPILAPGIGTRIRAIADLIGDRKEAADAADVSVASLQRYIAEDAEPTFSAISGLAKASGARLEWLAFEEGPMLKADAAAGAKPKPIDVAALGDVVVTVEEFLHEQNLWLEPAKKAELYMLIYEDIREHEGEKIDRARVIRLVKLAA